MTTNGMTQIEERTMQLIQSACKNVIKEKEIDWEQRKYEIAKDVLPSILSQTDRSGFRIYVGDDAINYAMELSEMLVNRLKNSEN